MKLYEEFITTEAKSSSQTRITRQAKISRAIGSLASGMAKQKNDPLHKRMMYHLDLYKRFKQQIMNKYSSRVRGQARR